MNDANKKLNFDSKIEANDIDYFVNNYVDTYNKLLNNPGFEFPTTNGSDDEDVNNAIKYLIAEKSLMFFQDIKVTKMKFNVTKNFYELYIGLDSNDSMDEDLRNYLIASVELAASTFYYYNKKKKPFFTKAKLIGKTCRYITSKVGIIKNDVNLKKKLIETFSKMKEDFKEEADKKTENEEALNSAVNNINTLINLLSKKKNSNSSSPLAPPGASRPLAPPGASRRQIPRSKSLSNLLGGYKKKPKKKVSKKKVSKKKPEKKKISKKKVSKTPMKSTVTRDGKKYVVRTGDRGGKYIMKNKVKVYL